MKIKAGIIGGAGYTGGELIRLLIHHPHTTVSFIHSRSNAGKQVAAIHQDLIGDTELLFTDKLSDDIDVLFLCLGHGESKKFLTENKIASTIKIIDLTNDAAQPMHLLPGAAPSADGTDTRYTITYKRQCIRLYCGR